MLPYACYPANGGSAPRNDASADHKPREPRIVPSESSCEVMKLPAIAMPRLAATGHPAVPRRRQRQSSEPAVGAAIALQQKLGAMTLPIRLIDIVDARFSPCVFSDRTDTPKDPVSAPASGQQ